MTRKQATRGILGHVDHSSPAIGLKRFTQCCRWLGWLSVLGLGLWLAAAGQADEIDFAHQIVPILKTHCLKCHSGPQLEGGFSLNDRESVLAGGDSGPAVAVGEAANSELLRRVRSTEADRMPPEGAGLTSEQADMVARWIDQGLRWEAGFTFAPSAYEPPLRPRRPDLPVAAPQRPHPIDRLLDHDLQTRQRPLPPPVSDEVFLRRVTLDLVGRLPTPEMRTAFLADSADDKRERWIQRLLDDDLAYAEHWLSFWNDLLRNDYTGTGFITGGRTQITEWLYEALLRNRPYDQFARELIAPPTAASAGFIQGIRWRGEVSAGQTVEIQFAQSLGQTFLGINLKCASCHDSFVDRWTLDEAFSLAAVYSEQPLELHRCDKPLGKFAQPRWLFPELGQVEPTADRATRLRQLADLLTHPENGRFTRTIVNRLWHRLMGRGIVHPVDAMQSKPWNEDLLDFLAVDLADHGYDLKRTLSLIANSQAYQAEVEAVAETAMTRDYVYAGPRAKRLTAEQFLDAIWQLTGAGPTTIDAPIQRPTPDARIHHPRWTAAAIEPRPSEPIETIRAALIKSDFLMRSLGRPNRDQIVTERPQELTTLEAIDLAIGETLDAYLQEGARRLEQRQWESSNDLIRWVFQYGLTREPSDQELAVLSASWAATPSTQEIADLLWVVIMLPEFQIVR